MYLRHSTRKKDGKAHTYWRLVRCVRRGGKAFQETVAQLGELDEAGRAQARLLAHRITGRGEQRELFEAEASAEPVPIRVDRVRIERSRRFGEVYLAWTLWRGLEPDRRLEELLASGREAISWATLVAILVMARLCEPSSELAVAEHWYNATALNDILGVPVEKVNDDRLYRALDRLLPHKEAMETHLRPGAGAGAWFSAQGWRGASCYRIDSECSQLIERRNMLTEKRLLPICVLLASLMAPTVALAVDAMPVTDDEASSPKEKELEDGLHLLDLWAPKPTNLSCTATSDCALVGGIPQACTGVTNCSSSPTFVTCDGQRTWCTCNPAGMSWCADPYGFCDCRVGGGVAAPAPHRPGRAAFPHPVPHVGDSLTSV